MRYLANATTRLPDGRIIAAGEEYDYPKEDAPGGVTTFTEIAQAVFERDQANEARMRGEEPPPQKRGPGRPRKVET